MSYFALGWEELARSLVWLGCSWCRKYKMPFCLMKSYSRTTGKPLPDLQLKLNVSTECQYFHHLVLRSLFNNISGSRGRTNYIANMESGKKEPKPFSFKYSYSEFILIQFHGTSCISDLIPASQHTAKSNVVNLEIFYIQWAYCAWCHFHLLCVIIIF